MCGERWFHGPLPFGLQRTRNVQLHGVCLAWRAGSMGVASHSGLRRECYALLCEGAQARFSRKSAPHPVVRGGSTVLIVKPLGRKPW
jgi:hypothetical protein